MHAAAATSTSQGADYGAWVYLVVFALTALSFAGVPLVGTAVVGWAAVLAGEGHLAFGLVLVVAAIGAEVGGVAGYQIGHRWGRQLLDRPGRGLARRKKAVARAERFYAKWGRIAVFFTSTIISGLLRMKFSQFLFWNFMVGVLFVLSVGPAAYGAASIYEGAEDAPSIGALLTGLAVAAGAGLLALLYYRRRRAHVR